MIKIIGSAILLGLQFQGIAKASVNCQELIQKVPQKLNIHVDTDSCKWDPQLPVEAVSLGLTRVCEVNPGLVEKIVGNMGEGKLSFQCDVTENLFKFPQIVYATSTIHLWKEPVEKIRLMGTIFHEFLHYSKLPVDLKVHNSDSGPFEEDPVYACHVTGYPEVAKRILGDEKKLPLAQKKCATVVLNGK